MEDLADWLQRAQQGEQPAFREIYRCFRPALLRLASAFATLDRDEVEDVVQESFVRAFRALPALRDGSAFERWLFSIARNRALSHLERKQNAHRVQEELAREPAPRQQLLTPPALQAEREEAVVRDFIAAMPRGPERETVELFYIEGALSAREIAEKLGVGKSTVTMRLERFRAKVKRELLKRVMATRVE
jgi:RNA polymerase sigma-70 factor (ECF subfamily)